MDLSDLENNLYNQSRPLKFENNTWITSEKLYDAIHSGSTSILLINIEKYVKMSQTWPFWPGQWPLEWFNKILLFTVHCHHPGEASCQNKDKRPPGLIAPLLRFWHMLGNPPKNTTKGRDLLFNEGIRLLKHGWHFTG